MASGAADGDGEGPIDAEGDAAGFDDGEAAAGAALGEFAGADVAGSGGDALEHAVVRTRNNASRGRINKQAKREAFSTSLRCQV
jgi:hypothetical protein